MILIETMNTLREAIAAARCAAQAAPGRWMLSLCTKSDGPPGILLSGEPVIDLLTSLESAFAIGVNCVAAPMVQPQVQLLNSLAPAHMRIMAYANVGFADEQGQWVCTDAEDSVQYLTHAQSWVEAGASIIGGCCGTSPAMIRAISDWRIANMTS